jgi:methionyl-tRNA formyltransferase
VRLVLLSPATLTDFNRRVLERLFGCDALEIVGVVMDARKRKTLWRRVREELRKGRGGYVLVKMANHLFRRFATADNTDAAAFFSEKGASVLQVQKLYDPQTLDWIRDKNPGAICRFGFGIIREPVLSMAPKGVLSYHHGDIRRYRGQPVAFWELLHGEREMAVTVQILNEGLDSGKIVKQIAVPIQPNDSWSSLSRRAFAASDTLLRDACLLLADEAFRPVEVPEGRLGKVYTSPNFRQWMSLQVRVAWRKGRHLLSPRTAARSGI